MAEVPRGPMSIYEPYVPRREMWLLFRVASHEHITALRSGIMYMNSLAHFAGHAGESRDALRADPTEPLLARVQGGPDGPHIYKFTLRLPAENDVKEIDVSSNATLTIRVPNPNNVMIFSLGALADDENGKIPGEANGELWLDKSFLKFGTHMLLIRDAREFSSRISAGIQVHPHLYSSRYFQGGYGLVEYVDLSKRASNIGLFRKDKRYSWQREFRMILGARDAGLNSHGALELEVGDLSDITQLIELEQFLKSPIKINRRLVRKDGDDYVEVVSE